MSALTDKIEALGFTEDADAAGYFEYLAADAGMDKGGPYVVEAAFVNDAGLFLVLERNTGDEDLGGLEATVKYPPVAILDGPKGRVSFNPDDLGLLERLVADLS